MLAALDSVALAEAELADSLAEADADEDSDDELVVSLAEAPPVVVPVLVASEALLESVAAAPELDAPLDPVIDVTKEEEEPAAVSVGMAGELVMPAGVEAADP